MGETAGVALSSTLYGLIARLWEESGDGLSTQVHQGKVGAKRRAGHLTQHLSRTFVGDEMSPVDQEQSGQSMSPLGQWREGSYACIIMFITVLTSVSLLHYCCADIGHLRTRHAITGEERYN